jgi:hypothetical protein
MQGHPKKEDKKRAMPAGCMAVEQPFESLIQSFCHQLVISWEMCNIMALAHSLPSQMC